MGRILVVVGLSATLAASSLSWAADGHVGGDAAHQLHRADGQAFPIFVRGTSGDPLLECILDGLARRRYGEYFEPADNSSGVIATVTILEEGVSVRISYGTKGPRSHTSWCVSERTACEQVARQLVSPYLAAP